ARLRGGEGRRHRLQGDRRRGAEDARRRPARPRRHGPEALAGGDPEVRRRPGRPRQSRARDRRGSGDDRGRARALSHPAGPSAAHAARPRRDAHGLPPLRPGGSGRQPRSSFRQLKIPVRVYYQDTDAGVVYHAQYLSFMERARSELLNAAGIDLARFTREHGVLFVVFQIAITYHEPARLNEQLSVSAEVTKIGRASLVFRQRVERGAELLCDADVTIALVDRERMRPARMPEELSKALR